MAKRKIPDRPAGRAAEGPPQRPSELPAQARGRLPPEPTPGAATVRAKYPPLLSPGMSALGHALFDRLDRGILLLDAEGAVIDGNSLAFDLLQAGDGLGQRSGRVAFTDPQLEARWTRLQARKGQFRGPAVMAARVRRNGFPPCFVIIGEVPPGSDARPVAWYVLIFAFGERREISPAMLTELFALTRAQAAVTSSLYEGHSVDATARKLGLSLNTVRSHLKQVFVKCEVQSQAELLHLLAQAPHTL